MDGFSRETQQETTWRVLNLERRPYSMNTGADALRPKKDKSQIGQAAAKPGRFALLLSGDILLHSLINLGLGRCDPRRNESKKLTDALMRREIFAADGKRKTQRLLIDPGFLLAGAGRVLRAKAPKKKKTSSREAATKLFRARDGHQKHVGLI